MLELLVRIWKLHDKNKTERGRQGCQFIISVVGAPKYLVFGFRCTEPKLSFLRFSVSTRNIDLRFPVCTNQPEPKTDNHVYNKYQWGKCTPNHCFDLHRSHRRAPCGAHCCILSGGQCDTRGDFLKDPCSVLII